MFPRLLSSIGLLHNIDFDGAVNFPRLIRGDGCHRRERYSSAGAQIKMGTMPRTFDDAAIILVQHSAFGE